MLVLSRSVRESFVVDESIVFTVRRIGTIRATLVRTTADMPFGAEVEIHVDGLRDIGPGLRAVMFPSRPGRIRIGVVASPERHIRRLNPFERPVRPRPPSHDGTASP
ncbi:hypothetical protein [Planctomyces sp. SH-PL14]|uniref:hypothetical protein n=1 Tax=Planctomyces sp. SH-PL14 TaxID=1632864 RepID=UPI0012E85A26|nr:hypothetical protein [Planctomyces sp. SH-PL14]